MLRGTHCHLGETDLRYGKCLGNGSYELNQKVEKSFNISLILIKPSSVVVDIGFMAQLSSDCLMSSEAPVKPMITTQIQSDRTRRLGEAM